MYYYNIDWKNLLNFSWIDGKRLWAIGDKLFNPARCLFFS